MKIIEYTGSPSDLIKSLPKNCAAISMPMSVFLYMKNELSLICMDKKTARVFGAVVVLSEEGDLIKFICHSVCVRCGVKSEC